MSKYFTNRKIIMKRYNASAKVYDQLYLKEQTEKRQLIIANNFQLGQRLLDVGCGTGISILDEYPVDLCIGIDISIEMLKLARDKGKEVILGDMTTMPFREYSFDCLTLITSFHHAPRKKKVVKEILRIMKYKSYIGISLLKHSRTTEQLKYFLKKELKIISYKASTKDIIVVLKRATS